MKSDNDRFAQRPAFLTVMLVLACAAGSAFAYVDRVVATVGREPILYSEIMQEIMPLLSAARTTAASEEAFSSQVDALFAETLEQAIEHHILYGEAKALDVNVPEDEIERRVAQVRRQYDSPQAFQRALEEAGQTVGEFRDRMRRQMMAITVGMSKRREFERAAVVTESDLAQFYQDHIDEFRYEARYRARRIFIQASRTPEARDAATERLRSLREELTDGADFAALAKAHSDGPEAEQGGMIGWIRPGDLVEALDTALTALAPGEVSPVIETEFGVHLMKLEEIESEGVLPYDEARNEIEPVLREERGDERYRQWMNTLRKRNNVRVLR